MNPILNSLIPEKTIQQLLEQSIQEAKQKLPQIKNYNVGGAFRTLLEIDALLHSELWEFLKEIIVPNMFVITAKGKWLDLHAETFGIKRKPAKKTIGKVIFKRSANGNIKIPLGTVVKTKPDIFGDSLSFKTIEEKVLTENLNEIEIKIQAIEPSSRYNVAPYTINTLTTYLPVEVENRENWIIQEGTDQEDDESLRQRILLVWNTKSLFTDDYYRFHTLSVEGVIDCYIDNQHPRGQGTADIYIVSTNITPTQDLINKVQAVINEVKTPASDILVKPAVTKPVDLHIKVYAPPDIIKTTLQTEVQNRVRALFIYDKKYEQIITNYQNRKFKIGKPVRLATIIEAIMDIPQVENVEILNPTTDVSVLPEEIPVINSLTIEV
ncbi:MAG: baseplate J/gp47 family protein, partial [Bacteroidetes bacterium]